MIGEERNGEVIGYVKNDNNNTIVPAILPVTILLAIRYHLILSSQFDGSDAII